MWHCLQADGSLLLPRVQRADSFMLRLRGLLGRSELDPDEGLLIVPCNSVHTIGMGFDIAVLFLSSEQRILHLIPELPPWRMSPVVLGARSVLELNPEVLKRLPLAIGDQLRFEPTGTKT
ncbi:MAG TPA: DUF192 domain-containing protein [Candidatus Obscuribacterales bacterium]